MSEPATEELRVVELRVHDFKRIIDVHLVPTGPVTRVIGLNESGKSSALDSICAVLGGAKLCPAMPIRKGQKKAEARLDLGGMIAVRRWWFSKTGDVETELTLTAADGTSIKRPQDVLDAIINRIAFDPLSFERVKPAERLAILAKVAGVDLAGFSRRRERLFNDRAAVNKDLQRITVELDAMPAANDEIPTEEVKIADIYAKIEEAEAANKKSEQLQHLATVAKTNLGLQEAAMPGWEEQPVKLAEQRDREIAELQATIERKQSEFIEHIAIAVREVQENRDELTELGKKATEAHEAAINAKLIDTAPLKDKLRRADATNNLVRQQATRRTKAAEGNAKLAEKAELEKQMEAIDEEKIKAVAAAALPIPGLSLGDEDVLLNKIPFEQCSSAQRLELSATIGLETNKLKLMLIHDGSLLDSDRMKQLEAIAERYKAQIIIERVSDGTNKGEIGVRIIEGYTEAELEAAQAAKAELAVAE